MEENVPRSGKRLALSTKVRDTLLVRILSGGFKPGERILEMRLAEELGTSQAPVREALRELEALGVIETQPNRGTRIRSTTASELQEIYDVRAELEGYAASLAAPALVGQAARLEPFVAEMKSCAENVDVHGFAMANAKFHETVIEASGNGTLLELWRRLDVRARTTVNIVRTGRDLVLIANSHYSLIEALTSGDAAAARHAMQSHIRGFRPQLATGARS